MKRASVLCIPLLAFSPVLWAQPSEISAANSARYLGSGRWEWTVYLLADPSVIARISCVEYRLHPTFPNPNREVCQRGSADQPFALTAEGWGRFTMHVQVRFGKGIPQEFDYDLKLVDTRCPNPLDQFTLKEGESRAVKGITPPVYVFAEEIHEKENSHLRIFRTSRPVPPRQVGDFVKQLTKLKSGKGLVLDADTYLKFDFSPARGHAELAVPLDSKDTIGFFASEPSSHKTINIRACR